MIISFLRLFALFFHYVKLNKFYKKAILWQWGNVWSHHARWFSRISRYIPGVAEQIWQQYSMHGGTVDLLARVMNSREKIFGTPHLINLASSRPSNWFNTIISLHVIGKRWSEKEEEGRRQRVALPQKVMLIVGKMLQ